MALYYRPRLVVRGHDYVRLGRERILAPPQRRHRLVLRPELEAPVVRSRREGKPTCSARSNSQLAVKRVAAEHGAFVAGPGELRGGRGSAVAAALDTRRRHTIGRGTGIGTLTPIWPAWIVRSNTRAVAPDWVKMAAPLPSAVWEHQSSATFKKACPAPPRLTLVPVDQVDSLGQRVDVDDGQHRSEDLSPGCATSLHERVSGPDTTRTHWWHFMPSLASSTVGPTQLPLGKPSTLGPRPSSRIRPPSSSHEPMRPSILLLAAGEMTGPLREGLSR